MRSIVSRFLPAGLSGFLLIRDHVDAELGQPGHRVFDLLGRNVVGWQDGIEFVKGDEAALRTLL